MTDKWKWKNWEDIDDEEVKGLLENNQYNGKHRLKSGITKIFITVLQCIMNTTVMNIEVFQGLKVQSNKYTRHVM